MNSDMMFVDLHQAKIEINRAIIECSQRGLKQTTKWLSELNFALKDIKVDPDEYTTEPNKDVEEDMDRYHLAKSFFDLNEYDRCAYFTEQSIGPKTQFLHFYSRYLSREKKRIDDMVEITTLPDQSQVTNLKSLATEIKREFYARNLDGYGLFLYGIVLKRLDLLKDAFDVLLEAINEKPMHWGAWLELSTLITDREKLNSLRLPDHWMKYFFLGHTYLDFHLIDEALDTYWGLQNQGFEKSNYITAQTALGYHNRRDVDLAISTFRQLQKDDPYRLENIDTYSNLLYVKEMIGDLASLSHQAVQIDKYRVETCCVIGNYYSLRLAHQKAVLYFQRALKLNPHYLSAWTLMGHEYMEMKNTNAAIQCYRQAIEVNRRDYRAWYGLGQTYEILKMLFYCLYYYKRAQELRPNDSRMLIALGETYEKLDRIQEAVKCYNRARNVGDIDGQALLKLAKLYDKLSESELAAFAFLEYANENSGTSEKSELALANKYLANYYLKRNQLNEAFNYAQKCLDFEETKEEAKSLLRAIASRRNGEDEDMILEIESTSVGEETPSGTDGANQGEATTGTTGGTGATGSTGGPQTRLRPRNQPSPMNLSY